MIDIPLGSLVNAAGGVVFILLGAWVLTFRPKRPATSDFGLYAVFFGVVYTAQNLVGPTLPEWYIALMLLVSAIAAVPAAWALLRLASHFPAPLRPGERWLLALPVATGTAYIAVLLSSFLAAPETFQELFPGVTPLLTASLVAIGVGAGGLVAVAAGVAAMFALRFHSTPASEDGVRRQYPFLAIVVCLFPGFFAGSWAGDAIPVFRISGGALTLIVVATAALWLRSSAAGPDARRARNVALAALGMVLAGMLSSRAAGGFLALDATGAYGVVRMAEVLLLAYAILRMQMLGLDVKVRWTIQKSTIAAAFVGVFFVVSEGAQQLFSDSSGPMVGVVAAGALVFALAPLQRVAERVASAAVPGTDGEVLPPTRAAQKEHQYRTALRAALRDGRVTDDEAVQLAGLAESLGLGAAAYERIRREVQQELAVELRPRARRRVP